MKFQVDHQLDWNYYQDDWNLPHEEDEEYDDFSTETFDEHIARPDDFKFYDYTNAALGIPLPRSNFRFHPFPANKPFYNPTAARIRGSSRKSNSRPLTLFRGDASKSAISTGIADYVNSISE